MGRRWVGKGVMKETLSERLRVEPDQVMGHSGSKLTKMKANSQYRSLFNTAKLYSHTQPTSGWPSLH